MGFSLAFKSQVPRAQADQPFRLLGEAMLLEMTQKGKEKQAGTGDPGSRAWGPYFLG